MNRRITLFSFFIFSLFIQHIALAQCDAVGGLITTDDATTICAGDGQGDPIDVSLNDNMGTNSAWVITDTTGMILGLPTAPPFDLDGAGVGVCLIWHLSHEDDLTGLAMGNLASDLGGCFDFSNEITVTRYVGVNEGGSISTTDPTTICAGDGIGDPIDVTATGQVGTNLAWVITDTLGNILGLPAAPPFNLEGAGTGVCVIWYLSYEDGLLGVAVGNNVEDLQGCYALSNGIPVTRNGVHGGALSADGGSTEVTICAGDGQADPIDVILSGELGQNQSWVITDTNGMILGLPPGAPFDLEGAGVGVCQIWNLSHGDDLTGLMTGNSVVDLTGCFDLSNPITVTRYTGSNDGGTIATTDPTTICAGDGSGDPIDVSISDAIGTNMAWVITDTVGNILGLPSAPPFDLDGAGTGVCVIWNLSYEDGLEGLSVGRNVSELAGCFDLSNGIPVTRNGVNGGLLSALTGNTFHRVVIANRASGTISVINSETNAVIATRTMPDNGEPMYAVYNSANNTVLVGDYDGRVIGFDGKTFEVVGSAVAGAGVFHMWLSPDNQQLWVNNELDKSISVIDPNTMTTLTTFPIPADLLDANYKPHDVILMPNNEAAFVTMLGPLDVDYVIKYSTATFTEIDRAMVGTDPHVSLTSANDKLYVASQGSGELKVLNRSDLSEVATLNIPNAHGLGMNPAGTYLYVGNISEGGTNATYTVDVATNTLVDAPVDAPFSAPHNYAVTSDNNKLFITHSGGANNQVSIYNLDPTPTIQTSVTVGNNPFGLVAYSYTETTTELTICAGDAQSDAFNIVLEEATGTNSTWVITDTIGMILGLPMAPPFDLDGAGVGVCEIWHLSSTGVISGLAMGNSVADITGCYDFSNAVTVTRLSGDTDGGTIATSDPTSICAGDGIADPIDVTLSANIGTNSSWVITDTLGNILGLPAAPPFDLEGAGTGVCVIWHLSHEDGLVGLMMGENVSDFGGCYDLSNGIPVTRSGVDGGDLAMINGATELSICAGDGMPDPIDITLTDVSGSNSAWVITDTTGMILGLPPMPPFDLDGAGIGVCLIWHLSYEDGLTGLTPGASVSDFMGCYDFSNPITVTRNEGETDGGTITTMDPTTICAGDGSGDPIDVSVAGAMGTNGGWIITDTLGTILGLPAAPPFDLDGAGVGVCQIWYIRYESGLAGMAMPGHLDNLQGCFDLSNAINVTRYVGDTDGGTITTDDPTTICVGDGEADPIDVTIANDIGSNSGWVITDPDGLILGLPSAPPFDLEGAGVGECSIYHIRYENGLEGNVLGNNLADLAGCYSLSNAIVVTRDTSGSICNSASRDITRQLDVSVFPTLTSERINIDLSQLSATANISIRNTQGKEIHQENIDNNTNLIQINVQNFNSGLYILRIGTENGVSELKFIKIE